MFHTYVRGLHGQKVDFDRAAWLMDLALLEAAKALRGSERRAPGDPDTVAQRVWNTYCELHREKYAVWFGPDVDETWDVPAGPQREAARLALLAEKAGTTEPDTDNPYSTVDIRIVRR